MDGVRSASNFSDDEKAVQVFLKMKPNLADVVEPSRVNAVVDPQPDAIVEKKISKKRRKSTSLRRRFGRPKRRRQKNKYSSTKPIAPPIRLNDTELTECLLFDDEDRVIVLGDLKSVHIHNQNKSEDTAIFEQTTSAGSSKADGQLGVNADSILDQPSSFISLCELSSPGMSCMDTSNVSEVTCVAETQHDKLHHVKDELSSSPSAALIETTLGILHSRLPTLWVPVADRIGIHVLQLSFTRTKTVRKQISILYNGEEDILVHRTPYVNAKGILSAVSPGAVKFRESTVGVFCDRLCNIVKTLYQYKDCQGTDDKDRKGSRDSIPNDYIDQKVFVEDVYNETSRSSSCERLIILGRGKRCRSCAAEIQILRKRKPLSASVPVHANTTNTVLSREQVQEKLKNQCKELQKKNKQINYLKKKILRMKESTSTED